MRARHSAGLSDVCDPSCGISILMAWIMRLSPGRNECKVLAATVVGPPLLGRRRAAGRRHCRIRARRSRASAGSARSAVDITRVLAAVPCIGAVSCGAGAEHAHSA